MLGAVSAGRPPVPSPSPSRWLAAGAVLLLSLPLMVALWVAVALWLGPGAAGFMALLLALDATLLLALCGLARSGARALSAFAFVLAGSALAAWVVVAAEVGRSFGLAPWESALRLGPGLFTAIGRELAGPADAVALGLALSLALWWNAPRRGGGLNGRRPAPSSRR